MPTAAGQRCLRHPGRLHRTSSMRHASSIESADSVVERIPQSVEPGIEVDDQASLGSIHDGTTPIVEDTPDSQQSSLRSTPCPGGHAFRQLTARRLRQICSYSPSDIIMPDAPEMGPFASGEGRETEEPLLHVPCSAQARGVDSVSGTSASVAQRQAIRDAIANNRAARAHDTLADDRVYEAGTTPNGAEPAVVDVETKNEHARGRGGNAVLTVLGALLVVSLLYAFFCWMHWPEMRYIRRRRWEVLGM